MLRILIFSVLYVVCLCSCSTADTSGSSYNPTGVIDNTCHVPSGTYLSTASDSGGNCDQTFANNEKVTLSGLKIIVTSSSNACGTSNNSSSSSNGGCTVKATISATGNAGGLHGTASVEVNCPSTNCFQNYDLFFSKQ